jgi:hypothetical protein
MVDCCLIEDASSVIQVEYAMNVVCGFVKKVNY